MDEDNFSIKDRVDELSQEELKSIEMVMSRPEIFIDAYSELSRVILYPDIDKKKVTSIKKETDKIDASLSQIGKGIRLIIYNKLNNKYLIDLLKKENKPELYEEGTFLDEINTAILAMYPFDIGMKMVQKYMKETEELVRYLNDKDRWLAYNLLGLKYFNNFVDKLGKFYPKE
jgi:hypothetical protein